MAAPSPKAGGEGAADFVRDHRIIPGVAWVEIGQAAADVG